MEPTPDPELTAIYARKSMKGDKKEITVNRQKRLALDDCEKLGLTVHRENVFVDNGASAWKRNRKRPGWDALIEKARRGEIRHIVECYSKPHVIEKKKSARAASNASW